LAALLITSETSIAQLHEILQQAFDWSGEHLHRFRIHGRVAALLSTRMPGKSRFPVPSA
jgi:hypothetical protein